MLTGTLYPLVLEALTGARISVGAPFFNLIFIPLAVPLLTLVPFGPMLAWKRGDLRAAAERLFAAFGAPILAGDRGGLARRHGERAGAVRRRARLLADRRGAVGTGASG